jgi:hypothetical protein
MSRKKRSKQRVVVGPKMRAVAGQQPGILRAELTTGFRSSDLFVELAQTLARSQSATETAEPESSLANEPAAAGNETAELILLLADVATGLWRLRSKMLTPGAKQPAEDNRRSFKQLESILDSLMQAGLQIRDHTGEAVPRGGIYTLKALAYEPTTGLAREQVIETLKPTITFKDRVIQTGEVIIGTPVIAE